MLKRILILTALFFASALYAQAQNNPYDLDDECYTFFSECEKALGTDRFQAEADQLLAKAKEKKDTKAEALYYIEILKNATRAMARIKPSTEEQDNRILQLHRQARERAEQLGYPQYFYYSYELTQNYFYNHNKGMKAMELSMEMQQYAREHKDEYGLWMSYRFMVSLYISESDYVSAKPYILRSLDLYYHSTDPVVRRQSVSRLYCDLADTYMVGSDSLRINVMKAVESRITQLDTLRCEYYLAKIAAYENKVSEYRKHRDYCLADPNLHMINGTTPEFFGVLDAILDKSFSIGMIDTSVIGRVREMKFIANIAESHNFKDEAFYLEKQLVNRYERLFASNNRGRISEFDSHLGNYILHSQLDSKEEEIAEVTRRMTYMALLILIVALLLLFIHQIFLIHRNRQLKKANEKVMLANAAKTRFVQNMSHEVRTPLNAIVGFSQLLSLPEGSFSEQEREEFSNHIINNSKMLTMLLDDILNASDIDSGKYTIHIEDGEVHFLSQAAISSTEHRLQPGVTMTYQPESEAPVVFRTDPRRVQQILINLLTNACKHTAAGSIVLTSSTTARPGFVRFAVTDTGIGVPPEDAERIFERFTKLNEFVQGTGLGLSICRDIAERMGASVYLDTTWPGPGARFVFDVPVTPPEEINK